ncbi:MAG: hypothetical protein MJ005_03090 [Methanocorpusculum sp.]|nr:hypothetical protein [Methanocorpusculum sp.]
MRTDWIIDVIIGVTAIFIFGVMMLWLPKVIPNLFGYLAAFLVFIAYLVIIGLLVVKRKVGINPIRKKKAKKAQ